MKALSRIFTRNLNWPENIPEDTYTYFVLKRNSLRLVKQQSAITYMQNSATFSDYVKKYLKFSEGIVALQEHFPGVVVRNEYKIPKVLIPKHTLRSFLLRPFWTLLYFFETILVHLFVRKSQKFDGLATPCLSSKKIYG